MRTPMAFRSVEVKDLMPLALKSNPKGRLQFVGEWPEELPRFEPEVEKRFPSLTAWQKEFDDWWRDFRWLLNQQQALISDKIGTTSTDFEAYKTATDARLAELAGYISALESQAATNTTAISSLSASITLLSIQINNLTTIVTGITAGPVVLIGGPLPEGLVAAPEGSRYWSTTDQSDHIKLSGGNSATGWS